MVIGAGHHFDVAVAQDVESGGVFRFDEQRCQTAVFHFDEGRSLRAEERLDRSPRLFERLLVIANNGFKRNERLEVFQKLLEIEPRRNALRFVERIVPAWRGVWIC